MALQIVAALVERERTGVGKYLDVALFDAAIDWMQTINGSRYRGRRKRGAQRVAIDGVVPVLQRVRNA